MKYLSLLILVISISSSLYAQGAEPEKVSEESVEEKAMPDLGIKHSTRARAPKPSPVKGAPDVYLTTINGTRTFTNAKGEEFPELTKIGPFKMVSNFRGGYWYLQPDYSTTYLFDVRLKQLVHPTPVTKYDVLPNDQLIFMAENNTYWSDPQSRQVSLSPYADLRAYKYPERAGGLLYVAKDSLYGLIDGDQIELLPFRYQNIYPCPYETPAFQVEATDGTQGIYVPGKGMVLEGALEISARDRETYFMVKMKQPDGSALTGVYSWMGEEIVAPQFTYTRGVKTLAFVGRKPGQNLSYLYDLKGELLSEEGFAQVYPLSARFVRVKSLESYTEENILRWMKGEEALPTQEIKYALFDLNAGKRVTGYLYEGITPQRGKDGFIARRDGLSGPLSNTGVELPGWK
ncbi:hypothetical protein [Neolewinella agarilytica]|uniref:WG containing repeat-containing protein n=1 Tax=Neolewinella agarilytica TaxID=478744 RepID=A0A1H9HG01_9BACT|nr:hypothetical protein [Neolewinella agarilytica]SEQ61245.1 hypothetical protein SAMN05444359_112146 [Neolewinella agarilytica]